MTIKEHKPSRRESKRRRKEVVTHVEVDGGGVDFEEEDDMSMSEDERNLRSVEQCASYVDFDDDTTGRLKNHEEAIHGIVKKKLPPEVIQKLTTVHEYIKQNVDSSNMVPWSGINDGDKKLRAFAFMGQNSLTRLDESGIRLYAAEKKGTDAQQDELANRKAICILPVNTKNEEGNNSNSDLQPKENCHPEGRHDPLDIVSITREVVEAISPVAAGLDPKIVCYEELIAYQINLHNGVRYLPAHLDFPMHEGFGKVICTVAIKGDATVILVGNDTIMVGGEDVQPAWKFRLRQGECYLMSDNARNRCLHAVLTDDKNGTRESLNLRFGLHTKEEAMEITKIWHDDEE
jgi:hypothetical protein